MASYSVFVVEPGAVPVERSEACQDCSLGPVWLLYLCIAFGILFIVMLIINLFLCSAMSCSCGRGYKEEKETSYLEDFDPYARSWQGSQYGSRYTVASVSSRPMSPSLSLAPVNPGASTSLDLRYSLSGGIKTVPVPYLPADTTRSVSSTSEYGAARAASIVSARPHSRNSRSSKLRDPSTTSDSNSGYSGKRLVAK